MQQKLSTSLEENQKYFRRILRTDKNFDIISRTTMVADRKAVYYFVDGFLKESIVEKLLEFFYSVTPEDLPEDSEELSRDAMPYVEVELLEDCEQITTQILSGVMCLFIDGYSRCFAMDCRTYPMRSVEEPDKDKVLRGPRGWFCGNHRIQYSTDPKENSQSETVHGDEKCRKHFAYRCGAVLYGRSCGFRILAADRKKTGADQNGCPGNEPGESCRMSLST